MKAYDEALANFLAAQESYDSVVSETRPARNRGRRTQAYLAAMERLDAALERVDAARAELDAAEADLIIDGYDRDEWTGEWIAPEADDDSQLELDL